MAFTLGAFYKFQGVTVPATGLEDSAAANDLLLGGAAADYVTSGKFGNGLTPKVGKTIYGAGLLASVFSLTDRGAIQVYMYSPSPQVGSQIIFADVPDDNMGLFLYHTGTAWHFEIRTDATNVIFFNATTAMVSDAWLNLLVIWDKDGINGGPDNIRMYQRPDGGPAEFLSGATGVIASASWASGGPDQQFRVGWYDDTEGNTFDGTLDNLKLWVASAQITDTEITALLDNAESEDYGLGGGTAPTINTVSLPNGTVGVAYNQTILASGSAAGTVWTVESGVIPPGLTLSTAPSPPDGSLAGNPTTASFYTFTLRCTNDFGFDLQALTVTIVAAVETNVYNAGNILLSEVKRVGIGYYSSPPPSLGLAPSIGYTFGPVTFDTEVSHAYANPDQATGPVQAHKTTESILVTIPFAEQQLANIARQLAYPIPGGATFSFGNPTDRPTQYLAIYIVGTAPDGAERQVTIHRCVAEGSRQWNHAKAEMVVISAQFRATLDITQPEGEQFFSIEDV